ncbi:MULTISPECIES: DUF2510 domain-containing protein [Streptomyces]|uniref:DUF2510 domain-containing protein n=2 Tax=Streptomyces TaxID=1883 RepID=A0A2U9NYH1_STRAS|nr:DUF2510 domain-containing protein [Streptomyces actuosus]AWT42091.1 hypothetical protein DMT42_07070 [Streptomyces actuosus]MBM4825286.1 DUF2510 domain-containing protein [Streptomyces actuosus]
MTPPPGWYRDPSAPHVERWWDGTAWTDHRRAPQAPVPPTPAPFAPHQAGPGQPAGPRGGSGRARAVALTVAGAVLAGAIGTGAYLLGRDDGGDGGTGGGTRAATAPATGTSAPPVTPPTSAPPSSVPPPADDPAVVVDQLNGITLPLPDGWIRPREAADPDLVMSTDGTYDCPGDPGLCRHGRVFSRTATATDATTPKALAESDIATVAGEAYDEDRLGRRPFGGLVSHRVVGSGQIAVAGRAGYYVRWRVTTEKGPGGYVQSLAFPSSVGTGAPVLVRFVFDAGPDGPPLSVMDRITRGIRPVGDADTGGGVGSSIGPGS